MEISSGRKCACEHNPCSFDLLRRVFTIVDTQPVITRHNGKGYSGDHDDDDDDEESVRFQPASARIKFPLLSLVNICAHFDVAGVTSDEISHAGNVDTIFTAVDESSCAAHVRIVVVVVVAAADV